MDEKNEKSELKVSQKFEESSTVKLARWIVANRWKVIFTSIVFAMGLGSGGRFLQFSNDYRVFFGKENPQLLAFEEVENSYTKNDNVFFIVTPKSGNVFEEKSLKFVQELTTAAWQIPYSTRVDSITNFQHTKAVEDDLYVANLVPDDLEFTKEKIEEIKKVALNESLIVRRLINLDGSATGVSASIQIPGKDPNEVVEVATKVREIQSSFAEKYPDFEIRLSGIVMMSNAFAEAGQGDAMSLTPIMYLIMLAIMAFLLRSFGATLASLGVIVLSTMGAMGIAGYLGIKLTPPSAIAPTIILTLAIADSVHILITMILLMRKGWAKTEALVESIRVNMQAVFLTSLTTIIGFLCLNFSDSPPFHDLGNITAIGVALAFLFSVTFLPAAVTVLPIKIKVSKTKSSRRFENFADWISHRYKKVLLVSSLLAVFFISMIPRIDLDDAFVQWFDHRVQFRVDTDYLLNNLTGIYTFDYSISSGRDEGINNPKYMAKVEEFAEWWRKQPEVIHVSTYTDIMKKINKTMHGDSDDWYKLPEEENLAAQYLLLYEMSLPFGLDLNNQIDISKSSTRMAVTFIELTAAEARAVAVRGNKWLEENAPKGMFARATGPSIMFSEISKRNIDSMIQGTILALILITIIMTISLKSFKYGLISLLPNAIPAAMTFGIWALTFERAGMAISIVASATLGIIVDDTVHFMTKYLRAKREGGMTDFDAIRYAFSNVGLALVVTSSILVIGFLILTYSSFQLNWGLGALSAITIAMALLIDFTFLPSVLLATGERKSKESKNIVSNLEIKST